MPFRPYTDAELDRAAQAYGLDPSFVKAVYAVESSNGTDPNAMRTRSVKRKRDYTLVRGPFQLEDGTVDGIIRKNKLGNVNVDDPDTHLDLAMRLMRELSDRYDGDPRKMAQAYLGGPGGVTDSTRKDELGTSTGVYGNKILAEMQRINGEGVEPTRGMPPMLGLELGAPDVGVPPSYDSMTPYAETDDMFGMSPTMLAMPSVGGISWSGLVDANRNAPVFGLGIPPEMGELPDLPHADMNDYGPLLAQWVNEEMDNRDFVGAAA